MSATESDRIRRIDEFIERRVEDGGHLELRLVRDVVIVHLVDQTMATKFEIDGIVTTLDESIKHIKHPHVLWDFRDASTIVSVTIASMLVVKKYVEELGGRMALTNVCPNVEGVLKTMGLLEMFEIYPTFEGAMAALSHSGGQI